MKVKMKDRIKDRIKELRVRIDGLSQLVKDLSGNNTYSIDTNLIPEKYDSEKLMKIFNDAKNGILQPVDSSRTQVVYLSSELDKTYDSLILAKAWLGKILGELSEESPYANDGKRKDVEDIEPDTDISSGQGLFKDDFELMWWSNELNHIEKLDWLREQIKIETTSIMNILGSLEHGTLYKDNVITNLCEARFFLGFELGKIRDAR